MYYSNGNYEAFASVKKTGEMDERKAYLIGSGLASLAAAAFLVRDTSINPHNITIIEEMSIAGGSLDGILQDNKGFIIRGGREMENHFECLWDLYRSIPSLEVDGSVLDEFYWLNKEDPNFSLQRATLKQGMDAKTNGTFTLSQTASEELIKLFFTPEDKLDDLTISDVFSEDFFASNFWLYWQTMFAFETWHSATEMRRYLSRFIHHIGGLPDFSALKFTKYNQYESLVLPLKKYLQDKGVQFMFSTEVLNVLFDVQPTQTVATKLICQGAEKLFSIELRHEDLVFITNGSNTDASSIGDHKTAAVLDGTDAKSYALWSKIAAQDSRFGRPDKFFGDIKRSNWESATLTTLDDKILPYLEKICKRDPLSGKVVTGGIVSVKDSSWFLSWTINRQPHFKAQPAQQVVVWIYGLFSDIKGDYIKKPMVECTGEEIAAEWLYHLGVPVSEIDGLAATSTNCIPVMMPYVTAYFMPRSKGDRPAVVPEGVVNAAFIGNFAETPRDTVFTTEYSVRTAMEAVYTLMGVDRGVPEVFASAYDVRTLLNATSTMMDGKQLSDLKLNFAQRTVLKIAAKKLKGTVLEDLLKTYHLI